MIPGSQYRHSHPKQLAHSRRSRVDQAPIYTMGSADVRAFSRNKRGVAGSLIWINFDRHTLLSVFRKARGRFLASKDEIRPQFRTDDTAALDQTAIFNSSLTRTVGGGAGATIDNLDDISLSEVSGFKELVSPWYSDQRKGCSGTTRSVHPAGPELPRVPADLKHQLTGQRGEVGSPQRLNAARMPILSVTNFSS